jgi:hypothetical protein
MSPTPPPALPPVTVEYANTLQAAGAKAAAVQPPYKFARAADGRTRVDSGNISLISNPQTSQTILLDHAKKTATVQPAAPPTLPAAPQMPHFAPPAMPAAPALPKGPTVKVEDLGKTLLQGHEVEGTRFITPPAPPPPVSALQMPKMPGFQIPGMQKPPTLQAPGMPKAPAVQIPGMPKFPAMQGPAAPKPPQIPGMSPPPASPQMPPVPSTPAVVQPPTTVEVWKSTKMGVPMLMKMTGGFGQLTQVCQKAIPGEPHPTAFQIPPGYKVIAPKV